MPSSGPTTTRASAGCSRFSRKTYCLYEAPNAEAIRAAARRANLPADVVIEVSEIRPELFA
jgi:uncharacterized protein DUF4242